MQKISLITSLYRSEKHLPLYIQRVNAVLAEATIPLEIVIVANDATNEEKRLLAAFADERRVQIIHCERETLYASWNRGIASATGDFFGAWNVDDNRTLAGLVEGQRLLAEAEIVDFAYLIIKGKQEQLIPAPYQAESNSPKAGLSPFFLARRSLYERAGVFSPQFRITGDFEWSKRPIVRQAKYSPSTVIAGHFYLHGDNLSGGANPLETVEFNIALLWHGGGDLLRPVEPSLMRQNWEAWGHQAGTIPDELAQWLWGAGAEDRYKAYQQERSRHPFIRRLRQALIRRGLLRS